MPPALIILLILYLSLQIFFSLCLLYHGMLLDPSPLMNQ